MGFAPVAVDDAVLGIELDGLGVVRQRADMVLVAAVGKAAVVVGGG